MDKIIAMFLGSMLVVSMFLVSANTLSDDILTSSDLESITADISASDLITAEESVEATNGAVVMITEGNGWGVVDNEKAAFTKLRAVTKQDPNTDSLSTSRGYFLIGKVKLMIQSSEETESTKTYNLRSENDAITGTLILKLQDATNYNEGKFGVYKGDLVLSAKDSTFKATVTMALSQHNVANQKIKDFKDKVAYSYSGYLELSDLTLKFQSTPNSKPSRLEFNVYGADEEKGTLILESGDDKNYRGRLKYIDTDGETVVASLKTDLSHSDNEMSGKLFAEYENGETKEGKITIFQEKVYTTNPDKKSTEPVFKDKAFDADVKSKAGVFANVDPSVNEKQNVASSENEKGFWKKFFGLFGKEE
ncbi:MAG: hypothetical protein AABX23_01000 [Nanoarchaeota archaeon]